MTQIHSEIICAVGQESQLCWRYLEALTVKNLPIAQFRKILNRAVRNFNRTVRCYSDKGKQITNMSYNTLM